MRSPRRGFTLIELSSVLAIIGLLTVISVPSYQFLVRRARASEAQVFLEAIAHAELAYFRDHGRYLECAPSTDEVPRGGPGTFDSSRAGWSLLGITGEAVHYRYSVKLEGKSFVAIAEGDLDGDGELSVHRLDGSTFVTHAERPLE